MNFIQSFIFNFNFGRNIEFECFIWFFGIIKTHSCCCRMKIKTHFGRVRTTFRAGKCIHKIANYYWLMTILYKLLRMTSISNFISSLILFFGANWLIKFYLLYMYKYYQKSSSRFSKNNSSFFKEWYIMYKRYQTKRFYYCMKAKFLYKQTKQKHDVHLKNLHSQ